MLSYGLFIVFVALAVYVQNMTGFALALVLLGLVGATNLLPLPDVVNVVSVIALVNAIVFLRRRGAVRLERALWPSLAASQVGIVLGVVALAWIAGSAYEVLRLMLGTSVILCAWMLWQRVAPLPHASPPASFAITGLISGLMSGLFAAGGPALVYQLYRQPWSRATIQESLIFFFGVGALARLLIVVGSGGFSKRSLVLAAIAVPVVFAMTFVTARRPAPVSDRLMKRLVCGLLLATGITMIYSASAVLVYG